MLEAKLVVVGGDAKAGEFNLTLPTVIGRGKEAGLTIPHALVSRAHTKIFERNGRLVAKDLGSLNGTFVNNTKIEGEQILEPSQLLTLGNVTFRAVYEIGDEEPAMDAGSTLNDRHVAATLVAPPTGEARAELKTLSSESPVAEAEKTPSSESILENDTDLGRAGDGASHAGSALSEIDSFEPDDSDSFGRLSEINSSVFDAQTRGPVRPRLVDEKPVIDVAAEKVQTKTPAAPAKCDSESSSDESTSDESSDRLQLGIETGQKQSPAVSSIDGLPTEAGPQVSFVGDIGELTETPDVADSVKIDLGGEQKVSAVDESRLGSFLKRLPK